MPNKFDEAVQAVINGDTDKLQQFLSGDPDLVRARSSESHRATLLHYLGANGVENGLQKTPPNAVDVCRILLEAGAEAEATPSIYSKGTTTLTLVASSIHPFRAGVQEDLVRALIAGGANPNGPNDDGRPLQIATSFGYRGTVDTLVSCGAKIRHIVDAAAAGDLEQLKEWIDEDGNVDPAGAQFGQGDNHNRFAWPPPFGCAPKELGLVYASRLGREKVVDFFLDRGTEIDAAPVNGETGLHWAAFYYTNDIIPHLLHRGIDVSIENYEYQTAEELAISSGNKKGAELIARANA